MHIYPYVRECICHNSACRSYILGGLCAHVRMHKCTYQTAFARSYICTHALARIHLYMCAFCHIRVKNIMSNPVEACYCLYIHTYIYIYIYMYICIYSTASKHGFDIENVQNAERREGPCDDGARGSLLLPALSQIHAY